MYLAWKEIRRNLSRFLPISSIIALVTALVLFVVALAEGLGSGNVEGMRKLDASLLVFQENSKLSLAGSLLPLERVRQIQRVEGVKDAGPVGFSGVTVPALHSDRPRP